MTTLEQKHLTVKKRSELDKERLKITNKTLFDSTEVEIPLYSITETKKKYTYNGIIYLVTFFIMLFIFSMITTNDDEGMFSTISQMGVTFLNVFILAAIFPATSLQSGK